MRTYLYLFLIATVFSQNIGKYTPQRHISSPYYECTSSGCTRFQGAVTLDSSWRWLHYIGNYDSCRTTGGWDSRYCPDPTTCARNCGYEGVNGPEGYKSAYGVVEVQGGVRLNYVTGNNVGSRAYFLESENKYKLFKLANRQLSFDVDVSTLECGMNGAIYLVQMEADGGSAKYPTNQAGAKYGTGYCDAQCGGSPFIYGQATSQAWGSYGACCAEFDLWEANKQASVYTGHPCKVQGYYRCQGASQCGDGNQRYQAVCDKDGCGLNPYRTGNKNFYGPGPNFQVDTSKPFKVVTQFLTLDGTDSGDITEIKRFYVQNGKRIDFPNANISGMGNVNSMSNQNCQAQMSKFGGSNSFFTNGGMKNIGEALKRGMVLVLSLWDDNGAHMKWLDGLFPENADPTKPGTTNGPCPKQAGIPADLRKKYPNAYLSMTNIRYGLIGKTLEEEVYENLQKVE